MSVNPNQPWLVIPYLSGRAFGEHEFPCRDDAHRWIKENRTLLKEYRAGPKAVLRPEWKMGATAEERGA